MVKYQVVLKESMTNYFSMVGGVNEGGRGVNERGRGVNEGGRGVNEGGRGVNEGGRGVNERVGFCKKECCHYSLVSLVAYFS